MRGETKEQRFTRIAENRVQRVLDSIKTLSQCANKRMYRWNEDQLTKIWRAIEQELKKCRERFETSETDEFKL